jgi:hypothetical protein
VEPGLSVGRHLALVLPGSNADPYTPPVYLPSLALQERGARVEVVPYPDVRPQGLGREDATEFDAFVLERVAELVGSSDWDRVTFVAKSRGTLFLSVMPSLGTGATVEAIWVTPLLGLDYVRAGVVEKAWRSLIVAGSADPYHDAGAHAEVCDAIGATSLVIDGGNHGLVVQGDARATVAAYAALAEASLEFAAR